MVWKQDYGAGWAREALFRRTPEVFCRWSSEFVRESAIPSEIPPTLSPYQNETHSSIRFS